MHSNSVNPSIIQIPADIHLYCVKADSFPAGIQSAQQKLTRVKIAPGIRNHFGVSYLYDGKILYMAAAQLNANEQAPAGCETYTLRKGKYISVHVADFRNNLAQIEKAFQVLTDDPRIDEKGCCAECYLPEGSTHETATDVRCMVRLAD
jgi:predicted transcriptional regulator YdeE